MNCAYALGDSDGHTALWRVDLTGKDKPEYGTCVDIVTKAALIEMIFPALLPLLGVLVTILVPTIIGHLFPEPLRLLDYTTFRLLRDSELELDEVARRGARAESDGHA